MKSVFPALLYVIIVCVILSLGCNTTVGDEICKSTYEKMNGEFRYCQFDNVFIFGRRDKYCVCRFKLPRFDDSTKQDVPSSKQDTLQKQDKASIGATMVLR